MNSLPMYGRSSDVRNLICNHGCEAQWALTNIHRDTLPTTVWFALGTALHLGYETCINDELTLADLHAFTHAELEAELDSFDDIIESWSTNSKRNLETVFTDLHVLVDQWWARVHPTSDERIPIYNQYEWPPKTEHEIALKDIGLYTTVDAIFQTNGTAAFGSETMIVDWKTGSSKTADANQLQIYMYGGRKEGWINDDQMLVGAFHHVTHEKLQFVSNYWGDAMIEGWIKRTAMRKQSLVDSGLPVFVPDWYCQGCTAKTLCPAVGGSQTYEEVGINIQAAALSYIPTQEGDST